MYISIGNRDYLGRNYLDSKCDYLKRLLDKCRENEKLKKKDVVMMDCKMYELQLSTLNCKRIN